MNYAILRVQKLKTNTAVRGSLKHAFRDQPTPNADASLEGENSHFGANSVEEAMSNYKGKLPEKVRKNGVRCIEYLMTGSPDAIHGKNRKEQDAYFSDCLDWLKEKHGAENVVYAGIHRDETTPHMYAYVVPLSQERDDHGKLKKPGKLNCREFLGGRTKLNEMQTDFAEKVGKRHGLERGQEGSRAKHTSIKEYYTRVNQRAKIPDIPANEFTQQQVVEKTLMSKINVFSTAYESGDQVKARIMPKIEDELKTAHAILKESKANQRKAESKQARAENSLDRFSGMEEYTKLSQEDQQFIREQVSLLKTKRKMEAVKKENDLPNKPNVKDGLER